MPNKPLFIIDLDRTLIDTDKIVRALAISLKQQGYDGDGLVDEIERARLSENDINAKEAISSLGKEAWKGVEGYLLEEAKKNTFVFDDAQPFLESLRSAMLPHIILTFGVSRDWQNLKLRSSGLGHIPSIVSDSREKSKTINSWKDQDGVYVPPGFGQLSSSSIVLIDDRPDAFLDISEKDFKGYLLDRAGKTYPDINLAENVQTIRNLFEVKI
jgi:hypothetical protein